MLLPLIHTSSRLDYTKQGLKIIKGCTQENSEVRTPSALTWVCTSHTFLTAGLMLTCKFIFSAKRNRIIFFPFLLKIKSFSGIRQLVDRWADLFPEKIQISNQYSISIHCISWGDWQKTADPIDGATADQVLGSCPPATLTQDWNALGQWPCSIRSAYAGFSPGPVHTANSCAIVQFSEKDSFLPNKRRKKISL